MWWDNFLYNPASGQVNLDNYIWQDDKLYKFAVTRNLMVLLTHANVLSLFLHFLKLHIKSLSITVSKNI
jgi:hypothetical protein